MLQTQSQYYDVNTGTFISRKPTGQHGPNLYWYARDNPLRYTDPGHLYPLVTLTDKLFPEVEYVLEPTSRNAMEVSDAGKI